MTLAEPSCVREQIGKEAGIDGRNRRQASDEDENTA